MMVSVIVPAYNIAPYLERCVSSICEQTYTDLELILVDDGSTDDTPAICDRLAKADGRIRVIHKKNGGVSSARNAGIEAMRGEFVCFIDGDDRIEPTLLADAVEALRRENADIFMYEYIVNSPKGSKQHAVSPNAYGTIDTEQALIHTVTPNNRFLWSKVFRSKLVEQTRFREDITMGEDTLFACHLIVKSDRTVYTKTPYYHYEIRENSAVTSSFRLKKLSGLTAYAEQLRLCEECHFSVAAEYACGALLDLAIALARAASKSEPETRKAAYAVIKKCVLAERKNVMHAKRIPGKTKLKTQIAAISLPLAVWFCDLLGEKA